MEVETIEGAREGKVNFGGLRECLQRGGDLV